MRTSTKFKYPSAITSWFLRLAALVISKLLWFIRYSGTGNIPRPNGGFIVVSNHATYLDPAWLSIPIRSKLRYMAWDQATKWPGIGRFIRHLGAFPVKHRSHITKSAIAEALASLNDGAALIVFPEGGREFADGKMLKFKSGAVHIAMHAKVPILPVTIRGGNKVWPRGLKYPRLFRQIEIIFHPPLNVPEAPEGTPFREYLELINSRLEKLVRSRL